MSFDNGTTINIDLERKWVKLAYSTRPKWKYQHHHHQQFSSPAISWPLIWTMKHWKEVHNYGFQSIWNCTAIAEVEKYRLKNIQLNYWITCYSANVTLPQCISKSDGKISQSSSLHLQIHAINTARSSARLIWFLWVAFFSLLIRNIHFWYRIIQFYRFIQI